MIVLDIKQGSPEWEAARIGLPTCSGYEHILTPKKLEPSSKAVAYRNKLLAEWMLGTSIDFENGFTDRGTNMEAQARAFYEMQNDLDVAQVGFVLSDDERTGGSPDGFIGDDGILEIKCPALHTHVGYVLDSQALVDKYKAQVQGYLYLTDRQWADILSYNPLLPSVQVRIGRDEKYLNALGSALPAFCDHLDECKKILAARRKLQAV